MVEAAALLGPEDVIADDDIARENEVQERGAPLRCAREVVGRALHNRPELDYVATAPPHVGAGQHVEHIVDAAGHECNSR